MVLLLTLLACKDGTLPSDSAPPDSQPPSPWDGGEEMLIIQDGQPALSGAVDGGPSLLWALDSGADGMYIDQNLAGGEAEVNGTLTLGSLVLEGQTLRALDLSEAEAALGVDLGGLAGQPMFEGRYVTLDYGAARVHFTDAPLSGSPEGSSATPVVLDYEVQGGLPILTLDLGGATPARFICDTGSGVTLITQSRFDEINDGSLPQLQGYVWATTYGSDAATITRLPTLGGAGLNVSGSWAVVVPDNHHLASLLRRAHIDAEGFIGYPFYRRGALGVDADQQQLTVWPYDALGEEEAGEWRRVGVELTAREAGFTVEMLFSPSDAADQGVQVGDLLLSIDGETPADLQAAREALRGEGQRVLELQRGESTLSVTVQVEDLLPL